MTPSAAYKIPSKGKLILFSSLIVTLLFSLPRFTVFRLLQDNPHVDYRMLFVRGAYSFVIAVLFFAVNLDTRKVRLGARELGINQLIPAVMVNAGLFLLLDFLLLRLHFAFFAPSIRPGVFRFVFHLNTILEAALVIMLSHIYRLLFYGQQMRMANEVLKKMNAETRYEVLKNQVNPHFLFNSLNTVNALIRQDKEAAMSFVSNLSDVFRYVLTSSNADMVTLKEEMQFMEAYAAMLSERYGDKIKLELDVKAAHLDMRLPPMALQTLVENSVKHNIVSSSKPLHVRIFTDTAAILTVVNNLQEKKMRERSTGLGLANLNQRCEHRAGRGITIRRTQDCFSVGIPLIV